MSDRRRISASRWTIVTIALCDGVTVCGCMRLPTNRCPSRLAILVQP
jgi:hypothetical protein